MPLPRFADPMRRSLQFLGRGFRAVIGIIGLFALWSFWLALVLLFALQLYVLSLHELAVPAFVLREVESRLAKSGLRATFTRTSFDPTGRVLAENVKLSLPEFPEPIVTARSMYVRLNPWMLVVGRIEPREVRIVGASAAVPAMLSPSGRPAELVHHVDATLAPNGKTLAIHQLSGRIAGIVVSARGTLVLTPRTGRPLAELIADFVTHRFAAACRQALEFERRARQFEEPALHLEFSPSVSGAATMNLTLLARAARLDQPFAVRAVDLRASTRLLLLGDNPASWVELSAGELHLPSGVRADGIHAEVYGRLQTGAFFFEPRELTLTADRVEAAGVSAHALSGQVFPRPLPRIDVTAVAHVLHAPLAVRGQADLERLQALVGFEGEVAPALLTPLSERLRVDVRKYFDFAELSIQRGEARFDTGWKFEKLRARVRVDGMKAYGVPMSDGRADIELDPRRFYSPDVFARVGDNFARGSYEQDLATRDYRFLLEGRLQPLAIAPWFRDWWRKFFQQLEFPNGPPDASVDVRGVWREGPRTSVFVFADTARSIIRGTELDRVRTRLFIRPGFFDGLEISTARGEGAGRGRFTFINPSGGNGWHSLDLAAESTLDLATTAKIIGPAGDRILQPFRVAQPPTLKINGRFRGPGAVGGPGQDLRLHVSTSGEFRFHDFPLTDASFGATVKDGDIAIDELEATFASGVAGGKARVSGVGEERRVAYDLRLNDASLGQVTGTLQEFFARRKGEAAPAPGKFVQEKANVKLNVSASAEGAYNDPLGFRGSGTASLHGPEIAEIPLLGMLSELLKFTTLRFTNAHSSFKIEGPALTFPDVKFSGPNAAIDAHGTYELARRELNFNARIFPFQESGNLIKSVVGAVLSPLSNAFEVKLTGSLEKPQWGIVMAPANLLRSLTPEAAGELEKPAAASTTVEPAPGAPAAPQ